jgi:hypothetical protein
VTWFKPYREPHLAIWAGFEKMYSGEEIEIFDQEWKPFRFSPSTPLVFTTETLIRPRQKHRKLIDLYYSRPPSKWEIKGAGYSKNWMDSVYPFPSGKVWMEPSWHEEYDFRPHIKLEPELF